MTDPLIVTKAITKVYRSRQGEDVHALEDVSLTIERGEFLSVVGRSGCGKSTLLSILGGLIEPSGGNVLISGGAVTGPRRDVGFVFQNPVLLPWKTTLENVLLPVQILGGNGEAARGRATELLGMVGLQEFMNKYPFELSGGMQQRTSLVRALMHDPAILLMDEPFGALDAMTREQLNLDIQRIWLESKKTVVFITHSIAEAVFLSDRVVVMSSRPGRVVDVIGIDTPRARNFEWTATEEFGHHVLRIRRALNV